MKKNNNILIKLYFNWLIRKVVFNEDILFKYSLLFEYLFSVPFTYINTMDENRLKDGNDLRIEFINEMGLSSDLAIQTFDNWSISLLEIMVALAIRIEKNIMEDDNKGNRTYEWFMDMLISMHLEDMDNLNFDEKYVANVTYNLLNHNYSYNGDGGLFTVNSPRFDMRTMEIWYQAMWYLEEKLKMYI